MGKALSHQIERGIEALKRRLGPDGAALLREVAPRPRELASFDFPLPRDYLGVDRILEIGFGALFPTDGLVLKVIPDAWLHWPHVTENGICLFGDRRPYTGTPERVVEAEIDRLHQLVREVLPLSDPASRRSHFEREITYYWRRQLRLARGQYVLLSLPEQPTELFALSDSREGRGVKTTWLSLEKDELEAMERRLGLRASKVRGPAKAGFYLPLKTLPDLRVPEARHLASWLGAHVAADALTHLESWLAETSGFPFRVVILRVPNAQDAFIALVMRGRHIDSMAVPHYGRRAGRRLPSSGLKSAPISLEKSNIQVLDPRIVHSRHQRAGRQLAHIAVTLVGVGSLGSSIATNLARAGVGKLYLVDPDEFVDANLGRHVLGIEDLGRYKTDALRDRLQKDVPSITVVSIPDFVQGETEEALEKSSLVVVSTADWSSEAWLWDKMEAGAAWALLQVWSEPHAVAGHALLSPAGSKAVGTRYFTDTGQFKFRFTDWNGGAEILLPGCGLSFVPGGPIGLNLIATLASRIAVKCLADVAVEPAWYAALLESPETIAALGGSYRGPVLNPQFEQQVLKLAWPALTDED